MSGWSTDADADALAGLAAGGLGASLRRLIVPGAGPLAVLGGVRVVERFRSGSGGLRVTLAWPAGLRGSASPVRPDGGVVRHGIPYAAPGEGCRCERHDCGGLVPVSWCGSTGARSVRGWSGTPAAGSAAWTWLGAVSYLLFLR